MKKINVLLIILTVISLISCASKESDIMEIEYDDSYEYFNDTSIISHKESTDDFLADFDVVKMPNMMMLTKTKKDVKAMQLSNNYLVPRTNSIEITFRNVANVICIKLTKHEREKIVDVCKLFLEQYENKTIPHNKVNSSTAYLNSYTTTWHGITGPVSECTKTEYFINCEFINKRPYLLIKFLPSRCDTKDAFTPTISLYMSPSQIRDFIEMMDQNYLNSLVEDLIDKAYTY